MKNLFVIISLLISSNYWVIAQDGDLVNQNFDAIVMGETANVAADGSITFSTGKWTNNESTGSGTNSTWNKIYSSPVKLIKNVVGNNLSNHLNIGGSERLTLLFPPQISGTVVFEARVKTPSSTGSSGFISLDNDPGATSIAATGRANLIYLNTTSSGTSTISQNSTSSNLLVTGLTPATWYYIKVHYHITGAKAGKWEMYYGTTAATTLITPIPIAYQLNTSAYALRRLYMNSPLFIDDVRIYQLPQQTPPPTATAALSVTGGTVAIGQTLSATYTYNSSTAVLERGTKWALLKADDSEFSTQKDTISKGISDEASTFVTLPYTIVPSDESKFFRFEVTPADDKGNVGSKVFSTIVGPVPDSYGSYQKMVVVDNETGAPQYTTSGTPGGWGPLASGQLVGLNQTRAYKGGVAGDVYGNYAIYKPNLLVSGAGYYRVKVVSVLSGSPFMVDIHHANPTKPGQYIDEEPKTIIPNGIASEWVDFGYLYFSADGNEIVKLSATSRATVLRTDAVSFTKLMASPSDNRLLLLSTDLGKLVQTENVEKGFDSDVTDYTLVLPASTSSYVVNGLLASENATFAVNGTPLTNLTPSEAIPFNTTATIVVTNNGSEKIYTIKTVNPAQSVANTMVLFEPIRDEVSHFSILPTLNNNNYTATIVATSPTGIIHTDGTLISRPKTTTFVDVTVQVQHKTVPMDVATKILQVRVTPTYVAPSGDLTEAQAAFGRKKTGLFVHYVPFLTAGKGGVINDINELADNFDAVQFAQDASDFGLEYVVFTAWHARMLPLFPSKVNQKWRDDRRTEPQMQSYSNRDVIGELITALNAKNIDLHLYIHPTDGHDFLDRGPTDNILQDQTLTGFNDPANDYAYWNQYVNELLNEVCERYGNEIKGFWIDGGANRLDIQRLRRTLRSYNPEAMIVENVGGNRSASVSTPGQTGMADHNAWEVARLTSGDLSLLEPNPSVAVENGKTWPAFLPQVALVVGNGWWAKTGANTSQYAAKDLYLYNVLIASLCRSGGLLYSTGCSSGKAADYVNGNIWDGGAGNGNIYATMKAVNDYIEPIGESIKNTNPGKAYPSNTTACSWLDQYQWGVSTESADDKYVYLHVVNPPSGKTLSIGTPADNSSFETDAIVLKSKQKVGFVKTATGYDITLPKAEAWDDVNTVIRLQRSNSPTSVIDKGNDSSVRIVDGRLLIKSESDQQLDIFAIDGTKLLSCPIVAGENTVLLNRKGMYIYCLSANKSKVEKIFW